MRVNFEDFEQSVGKQFAFLGREYGCQVVSGRMVPPVSEGSIVCRHSTSGVRVTYNYSAAGVYGDIGRLTDGVLAESPWISRPSTNLPVYNLDDLIRIKAPSLSIGGDVRLGALMYKDPIEVLDALLTIYAEALRVCAVGVPEGDSAVFAEVDPVARRNPFAEVVRDRFAFLENEYGFELLDSAYSPSFFGNSLFLYMSASTGLSMTRDRSQVFVEIGPASAPSETWTSLNQIVKTATGGQVPVPIDPDRGLNGTAAEARLLDHLGLLLRQYCEPLL